MPQFLLFVCRCSALPMFLFLCSNVCSYGSTVPVSILPLFPLFLFSYCSSVPAVPRFYTFFFYSFSVPILPVSTALVPTVPQFLHFHNSYFSLCSYSSPVPTISTGLLFLFTFHCYSSFVPCQSFPEFPTFLPLSIASNDAKVTS